MRQRYQTANYIIIISINYVIFKTILQ